LTKNLLLTSCLVQLGYTILLNCSGAIIQHLQTSLPPLVACAKHNMLVVDLSPFPCQALMTRTRTHGSADLITLGQLHLCMGHISLAWLLMAAQATTDMLLAPRSELASCNACIRAKQHWR